MGDMKHTEIHGVALETEHIGGPPDRAPLVFLHEGLGSVSMWGQRDRYWPRELCAATGRAGWVYSRRGYGRSDPIPDVRGPSRRSGFWPAGRHQPDYMHLEAWEVLPALLSAWGISRPVLVGHSDGATIALLHAARCPTTAAVVMAPHVFVEDVAIDSITAAREAYDKGLRERLARHHADVDNAFRQWNDVWLSEGFRPFDIREECRRIASPLLLVQGLQDDYGTLEQLRAIERAAPHASTRELADCGHSPHRDQPEELNLAITEFLARLP